MAMRRVDVVAYDSGWPAAFEAAAGELRAAIGDNLLAVHHIGSTAIPGIFAKPVIDLLPVVANLSALDGRSAAMASLGYEVMGEFGIAGRRYFRRDDAAGVRTHHVHAFVDGSGEVERHLAFRDFMRAHPEHAATYGQLKRRLAASFPTDVEAYMEGKDALIKDLERRALAWRGGGASATR